MDKNARPIHVLPTRDPLQIANFKNSYEDVKYRKGSAVDNVITMYGVRWVLA